MAYTKTDKELKEKVEAAPAGSQRYNLIYQWVKSDKISFRQFNMLLDYLKEKEKRDEYYDE